MWQQHEALALLRTTHNMKPILGMVFDPTAEVIIVIFVSVRPNGWQAGRGGVGREDGGKGRVQEGNSAEGCPPSQGRTRFRQVGQPGQDAPAKAVCRVFQDLSGADGQTVGPGQMVVV